jgi:hypothetical protein
MELVVVVGLGDGRDDGSDGLDDGDGATMIYRCEREMRDIVREG